MGDALDKKFIQHLRLQHKEKYACPVCFAAKFQTEDYLLDHVRQEHQDTVPQNEIEQAALRRKALTQA